MNDKHRRFVAEYLIDHNAAQAAIRSGYSRKTAKEIGYELLTKPHIQQAVKEGKAAQLEAAGCNAHRVLEEMRRLALSDIRQFFDEQGNLKPIRTLGDDEASAVASVEVIQRNLTSGDGQVDTIHKLKTWDKVRALEMLGKHFALLTEQVHHSGEFVYHWKGAPPSPKTSS